MIQILFYTSTLVGGYTTYPVIDFFLCTFAAFGATTFAFAFACTCFSASELFPCPFP